MLQVILYLILYTAMGIFIAFIYQCQYIIMRCVLTGWLLIVEDGAGAFALLCAAEEKEFFYRRSGTDALCELGCLGGWEEKVLEHLFVFWGDCVAFYTFFLGGQERTKEAHKRRRIQHRRLISRDLAVATLLAVR